MPTQYIKKILSARVYDVAIETPLEPALNLSRRKNNNILLKREDLQRVFSFKLRGAYICIYQLTQKGIDLIPVLLEMIRWSAQYDANTFVKPAIVSRIEKDREGFAAELRARVLERQKA